MEGQNVLNVLDWNAGVGQGPFILFPNVVKNVFEFSLLIRSKRSEFCLCRDLLDPNFGCEMQVLFF